MTTPSILCLDPGGTTGWAYISPANVETGTIHGEIAGKPLRNNHFHNALVSLRVKFRPDQVIVERMPLRLQPWLREIVEDCATVFPGRHLIGPGEWKPVSGKVKCPFVGRTVHERDAYRMGRFYLFKFWGVGLSE